MVKNKTVDSIKGEELRILLDTVCIHSDTENAIAIAKELHSNLVSKGMSIGF
jgi:lactam utilization protein B